MYASTLNVGLGQRLLLRIQHTSNNIRLPWSELTVTAGSVSREFKLHIAFQSKR